MILQTIDGMYLAEFMMLMITRIKWVVSKLNKNTLEVKFWTDFELIKGLNEWDDAYRVIPQPTAWPYQEDMVEPIDIQKQQDIDINRLNDDRNI